MVLPRFSRAGFMTTSLNDVAFEKLGETVKRLMTRWEPAEGLIACREYTGWRRVAKRVAPRHSSCRLRRPRETGRTRHD